MYTDLHDVLHMLRLLPSCRLRRLFPFPCLSVDSLSAQSLTFDTVHSNLTGAVFPEIGQIAWSIQAVSHVGGGCSCVALSSGGESDPGYIKTPHRGGILQTLWPHCGIHTAVIVHILFLQYCGMWVQHLSVNMAQFSSTLEKSISTDWI